MTETASRLVWQEDGHTRSALWQADNGARLPSRVQAASGLDADEAYRQASAGTGLLWRGDFQQARQLLLAVRHGDMQPQRWRGDARQLAVQIVAARQQHARGRRRAHQPLQHGLQGRALPQLPARRPRAWPPPCRPGAR